MIRLAQIFYHNILCVHTSFIEILHLYYYLVYAMCVRVKETININKKIKTQNVIVIVENKN